MPANRTCAFALLAAASLSVHASCAFDVEVNDSMAFQIKEMVAELLRLVFLLPQTLLVCQCSLFQGS